MHTLTPICRCETCNCHAPCGKNKTCKRCSAGNHQGKPWVDFEALVTDEMDAVLATWTGRSSTVASAVREVALRLEGRDAHEVAEISISFEASMGAIR